MKLNPTTQEINIPITMSTSANSVPTTINNKSKHNPIAKFFTRISSVPTTPGGVHTKNSQFVTSANG